MNEDNSKKQIQINTDFIKIKKKRQTRKKNAEPKLSSQTINTIKNNLVERIQNHKINEMGNMEHVHSNTTLKRMTHNSNNISASPSPIINPPSNHLTDAMQYLSKMPSQTHLNKTLKNTSYRQPELQPNIQPDPPFGNLKGGEKPSYRDWKNQTLKHRASVHINEPVVSALSNPVKIIRKRRMALGKSKNGSIGVLVKNAKTRKDIIKAKNEIQSTKIHDIKNELFKKGLIQAGSTAPDDVLKNIYESSVLAGDVINSKHMYENILEQLNDE